MKKILIVISALALAFSCSPGPSYSTQYTAVTTFEYDVQYGVDYLKEFAKDSTFYDAKNGLALGWGDLGFFHKVSDIDKSFQGGWKLSYQRPVGLSRDVEKPADYLPSNYRSMGPHTGNSNKTYAVFCQNMDPAGMPKRDVEFLSSQYGTCFPIQCWVNNSEAVYEAVKKSFQPGDRLVLKAIGYLGGVKTDEVSIQMAAADTVMYNWSKLDLSKLGSVDAIDFELTSTKGGIPMYFCMDELSAKIAIEIE
jgi:hypothetical protein